jgi:hypothetical protein
VITKAAAFIYFISTWMMFHQVGSQFFGKGKRGDKWKKSSFLIIALIAIGSGWAITTDPVGFNDGTYEGTYELTLDGIAVLKMTGIIAMLAIIEGYGVIRILTLIFNGKDAASGR